MSKVLIVVNYEINKDYIAKNLCVNKDKPRMKCNGKCHLQKQLAGDEQNKGSNSRSQENDEVTLFFNQIDLKIPLLTEFVARQKFYAIEESFIPDYIKSIFHPPSGIFSF